MSSKLPSENNGPLGKLLREWRVDAALPPRFQERVWERIVRAETRPAPGWRTLARQWLETKPPRPAFVTAYMAILLLLGVGAGYHQGQTKAEHAKSELQARYVQMVDPYQTPR